MAVKNFTKHLLVSSPAFSDGDMIPEKYTCDGEDVNPPLLIKAIPSETKSLVLFLEDPDAPSGVFDHWVLYNISPDTTMIEENQSPGTEALNSSGKKEYMGPCPPKGTHHYVFKVFALDTMLVPEEVPTKRTLEKLMEDHILAKGELTGVYKTIKEKIG